MVKLTTRTSFNLVLKKKERNSTEFIVVVVLKCCLCIDRRPRPGSFIIGRVWFGVRILVALIRCFSFLLFAEAAPQASEPRPLGPSPFPFDQWEARTRQSQHCFVFSWNFDPIRLVRYGLRRSFYDHNNEIESKITLIPIPTVFSWSFSHFVRVRLLFFLFFFCLFVNFKLRADAATPTALGSTQPKKRHNRTDNVEFT